MLRRTLFAPKHEIIFTNRSTKATESKRFRELFLEEARRNMMLPMCDIGFVEWMNWLIVEAEKMSGETWFLDALRRNTEESLADQRPDGACGDMRPAPRGV